MLARGRRTSRQHVERLFALLDPAAADQPPEQGLVRAVMPVGVEHEDAAPLAARAQGARPFDARALAAAEDAHRAEERRHARLLSLPAGADRTDGPAGQDARQRDHVGLAVAAIDAQRVQLHEFARVILVQPLELAPRPRAAGRRVEPVVEIEQHRRMLGGGAQEISEAAEQMRPDRLLDIGAGPQPVELLADEDVEVIEPEFGEQLLELARALDRPHEPRRDCFADDELQAAGALLLLFGRRLGAGLEPDARPVFDEQLRRRHPQRDELRHPLVELRRHGDRGGVELLVNPAIDTRLGDPVEVAGPRPVAEPVADVADQGGAVRHSVNHAFAADAAPCDPLPRILGGIAAHRARRRDCTLKSRFAGGVQCRERGAQAAVAAVEIVAELDRPVVVDEARGVEDVDPPATLQIDAPVGAGRDRLG